MSSEVRESPSDARHRLSSLPISTVAGPEATTLSECFHLQLDRVGDEPAIVSTETTLTYRQLDRWANHLALQLPTDEPRLVAVLAPQGPVAIAANLGVLKAGHAFVPLDPAHPDERNRRILELASVASIVTTPELRDIAADLVPDRPVLVAEPQDSERSANPPAADRSPDDLAYVIFTSGSTGRPKGVMQTDRNLLHFVRSYASSLRITDRDRLTLLYSPAFSAILMDIFGGLLSGATLYPYDTRHLGLADLPDFIDRHRLTVFHSVPTVFRYLCESLASDRVLESVRILDLGGEPVLAQDVELFRHRFGADCLLVNHLAFTEASVAAQFIVDRDTPLDSATVPAGFPADGVQIDLVDAGGEPVPAGETGQMKVSCTNASIGYYSDPETTESSFTSGEDGQRCYWPGDLGRFDNQGRLWHVGRDDSRLKVRGHTVELGEIESALRGLEGVFDAAVVARQASRSRTDLPDVTIQAFVVMETGTSVQVGSLRAALLSILPEYMLPSAIHSMDALPLTATGKVDRRALTSSAGVSTPTTTGTEYLEPRNGVERELVAIWQRLLRTERVGVHDDFFALGGDSLLAVSMLLDIERSFGKRLPLHVLAQVATIERLAPTIAEASTETETATMVALQPHGDHHPIFLVPGIGGHPLRYGDLAHRLGAHVPLYSFQLPGLYGECEPLDSIEALAEALLEAILEQQPDGPYFLAGYSSGGTIALEIARRLETAGRPVSMLAMLDAYILGSPWQRLGRRLRRLAALPGADQVRFTANWIGQRLGLVDRPRRWRGSGAGEVLYAGLNRVLEANHRAGLQYRPSPIQGHIDLFRAEDESDWAVPVHQADYGWGALAASGVTVHLTPGDHYTMIQRPFARSLAERLLRCLHQRSPAPTTANN